MNLLLPGAVIAAVLAVVVGGGVWILNTMSGDPVADDSQAAGATDTGGANTGTAAGGSGGTPPMPVNAPPVAGETAAGRRDHGIVLSRETTFLTGPVNQHQTIDSIAALNEAAKRGIPPEQNAGVEFARLFGSGASTDGEHAAFEERLGVTGIPRQPQSPISESVYAKSPTAAQSLRFELNWVLDDGWTAHRREKLAAWLDAAEEDLQRLGTALEKPGFYVPYVPLTESGKPSMAEVYLINFAVVQECRHVSRLLSASSRRMLFEGNPEGAIDRIATGLILSRRLQQLPMSIESLVGASIEAAHMNDIAFALRSKLLDATQLDRIAQLLADLPEPLPLKEQLGQYERLALLDVACDAAVQGPEALALAMEVGGGQGGRGIAATLGQFQIDWNACLREINRRFDELIAVADASSVRDAQNSEKQLRSTLQGEVSAVVPRLNGEDREENGRAAGLVIVSQLALPVAPHVSVVRRRDAMMPIVEFAIAAERFRQQTGKLPLRKDELSDAPDLPPDPMTGAPLQFRSTSKGLAIYSVSANFLDDGGPGAAKSDDWGVVLTN